jgi:subtilisin family serine protease
MRRHIACLALVGLSLALAAPAIGADPQPTSSYLIQLNGAGPADLSGQVAAAGGTLAWVRPEIGYAAATSSDPGFASTLKRAAGVQSVDQDLQVQWVPTAQQAGAQTVASPAASASAVPTSAFFYACQWNLAKIDAPGAWAKGFFGSPGVKVAVLDTGVDPFHIDLAGKIDTANSTSFLTPGSSPCGAFDEGTIFDLAFHGSFVSGLITSNNLGVAGVAPNAQVVGVKVLNCAGSGRFSDLIPGIVYAANLPDVDVLNMSLTAAFGKNLRGAGPLVAALNKALDYAGSQGKLVVSAAGNSHFDMDKDGNVTWVPAQSGSGLGIYATNNQDHLASYSNHGVTGTWVGAPGGDFPNAAPPLPGCAVSPALQGLMISVCSSFVCGNSSSYLVGAGTSFASPTVAGVAALVDGKHGGALDAGQLKTILSQSADDLGNPGTDNLFSHGRVNASQAVDH